MNTLTHAWDAVSPTPVQKGGLIEPEATDRFAPRPWLHLPPGALALVAGLSLAMAAAVLQVSFSEVQRQGLPAVLPEGLPGRLPHMVPRPLAQALQRPLLQPVGSAAPKRVRTKGRLHRVLRDQQRTEWSRAG